MPKNIQIKRVPDKVHRTLKARAAQAGMTLNEYMLRQVAGIAGRPTLEEIFERVRARGPVRLSFDPARAIRDERDAR